jgi:PAS domain S-box-containing protein
VEELRPRAAPLPAEHWYRWVFQSAPDGLLATDLQGRISEANHAATILMGARARELVGRPLSSLVCLRERAGFAARLARLHRRSGATEEWQVRMQPLLSRPFDASVAVRPFGDRFGRGVGYAWSVRDITRRKRIEGRLQASDSRYRSLYRRMLAHRDRLRELSSRALQAREEEARRIAHQLHDETGQITASIHLALEDVARGLSPGGRRRIRGARALLDQMEERLRRLSHELRPTILDDLGLMPALEFLGSGFSSRTGTAVEVCGSTEGRLPPVIETAVYRIVQEALANVARHARASRVVIRVERRDEFLRCSVRDDGVGLARSSKAGGGLGLLGIRERLDALGGRMRLGSPAGSGTELRATIPLEEAP